MSALRAIGCSECAWGKVAGCWRCGSRIAATQQTPGPWFIEPVTDGPGCCRWSVARWNPNADPGYDYESMVDARGGEAIFASTNAARDAIATATGSAS